MHFLWGFLDMAKGLLSIVSIYEHLAKTIDSVRAWVQQHEKLIYQGMDIYCYDLEILWSRDFWVQILGAIFFHISVSSSVMLRPVLMFRATR